MSDDIMRVSRWVQAAVSGPKDDARVLETEASTDHDSHAGLTVARAHQVEGDPSAVGVSRLARGSRTSKRAPPFGPLEAVMLPPSELTSV